MNRINLQVWSEPCSMATGATVAERVTFDAPGQIATYCCSANSPPSKFWWKAIPLITKKESAAIRRGCFGGKGYLQLPVYTRGGWVMIWVVISATSSVVDYPSYSIIIIARRENGEGIEVGSRSLKAPAYNPSRLAGLWGRCRDGYSCCAHAARTRGLGDVKKIERIGHVTIMWYIN